IGVATFDGLNKHGYPYTPNLLNFSQSLPADTLTSREINLFTKGTQTLLPTSNIALRFKYQARGRGDSPEQTDSLLVDFFKPMQNTWNNRVWIKRGNSNANTNDTIFQNAFVWIRDTAYLHDNFKFRFRNKATTAGDFDHWHIDFVELDMVTDSLGDSTYVDMAFGYVPTPFLKDYSAIPWQHYATSENGNSAVFIRNNGYDISSLSTNYNIEFIKPDNTLLGVYTGGSASNAQNPGLFRSSGWSTYQQHANPASVSSFTNPYTTLPDSIDYKVRHTISTTGSSADEWPNNDTVVQVQRFRNYFAFDDGSAEGGYFVNGTGGKMAVKVKFNVTDTLRALRIYFDPTGSMAIQQNTMGLAQSSYNFRIIVWADNGGSPSFLLLRDSLKTVSYYNGGAFNMMPEYKLTSPIVLSPGTYYIGIQQYVASGITVGFDKNINHSQNLYFDSGSGWTQSGIYGSLMMRPVVGTRVAPPVGINDYAKEDSDFAVVYPNPASEKFIIQSKENFKVSFRLMNSLGQAVKEETAIHSVHEVSTGELSSGVYFLVITSGGTVQTKKIIIQH
ncbi:MAG: T9SS type A sorting domain-containing protein, partial [Bacteroidetes bacterium]|nr:T9SS type A sorting domain-containing protein [Bacteroidota bacterium]